MTHKYHVGEAGIAAAVKTIGEGGTIVYPTETCYGLGGDALNRVVIDNVYKLKQRPRSKGLTVVVSDIDMAERFCVLSPEERHLCEVFMPGPLTIVATKRENVPGELNEKFVFRIPGDETARELSRQVGVPVVATSANISGRPQAYSTSEIDEAILHEVDVVLDGGTLEERQPSTVVELTDSELRIHREGPVKAADLRGELNG